jgi:hypothetical protein
MKDALGHGSNGRGGANDAGAAATLANGHPKAGLVGIHSASLMTRMVRAAQIAYRNSNDVRGLERRQAELQGK